MKFDVWLFRFLCLIGIIGLLSLPFAEAQSPVTLSLITGGGNITVNGGLAPLSIPRGYSLGAVGVEAAGTWSGTIQLECTASAGGTGAFVALTLTPRNSSTTVTSFTGNGQWVALTSQGCQRVQARATATMTGSALITLTGVPAS